MMGRVSYGLLNNFILESNIPSASESEPILLALKSVAHINISELPGKSSSSDGNYIKKL